MPAAVTSLLGWGGVGCVRCYLPVGVGWGACAVTSLLGWGGVPAAVTSLLRWGGMPAAVTSLLGWGEVRALLPPCWGGGCLLHAECGWGVLCLV